MNTFKYVSVILLLWGKSLGLLGQNPITDLPDYIEKQTVVYAVKQADTLRMDIYRDRSFGPGRPVMMFQFGGSFKTGSRDRENFRNYFIALIDNGFTVVSIDYRLGMKGKKIQPACLNFEKRRTGPGRANGRGGSFFGYGFSGGACRAVGHKSGLDTHQRIERGGYFRAPGGLDRKKQDGRFGHSSGRVSLSRGDRFCRRYFQPAGRTRMEIRNSRSHADVSRDKRPDSSLPDPPGF